MLPFRKIRWVKSVTMEEEVLAYSSEDRTSRAPVPRRPGDEFPLHATKEDRESLAEPAVNDLMVLTQNDQVTHLVRVVGASVEPRPKRTIRKKTRDTKFLVQRTMALVILRDYENAPYIDEAFGFDPKATGGETFEIEQLATYQASMMPLWAVQKRIERALLGLLPRRTAHRIEALPVRWNV